MMGERPGVDSGNTFAVDLTLEKHFVLWQGKERNRAIGKLQNTHHFHNLANYKQPQAKVGRTICGTMLADILE